ncbi:MAG: heme ABC exporter ATP-binding protein CcmA [Alphaproteobacteria bacterium]|nr:heme ABC exporter ATP-binding protein CcmA [Alphaproteobacteria bacterium]
MSTPVLQAQQLSRRYGRRWALARVDLEVQPGERLLIVGANGSGKTTLLRTLATLIQPTVGSLKIFGFDAQRQRTEARSHLALLSHANALYEDLSGPENLRVVAGLLGRAGERVEPLLEQVGLELRDDPVRGYSAGMRKRLAFARLLLQRPGLALLDEPYGQLDPAGFNLVDALVDGLTEAGTTVVMASHLVDRAGSLCDRAMLLDKGQVRWQGPAGDIGRAWGVLHGRAA